MPFYRPISLTNIVLCLLRDCDELEVRDTLHKNTVGNGMCVEVVSAVELLWLESIISCQNPLRTLKY